MWLSAILLVTIPLCLALDFGGIYHWSQYFASFGILVGTVLVLPGLTDSTASSGMNQHRLMIPLVILVGWSWVQSLALSPGLVAWISPGSHAAYSQWLGTLLGSDPETAGLMPDQYTLSVSPADTSHVAGLLTMMLPLSFAASIVFHSRGRLKMLLSAIAIAGASVAVVGFYRKLDPTADWWIFNSRTNSFAGFVNRNNAALMLNFGLAASLGLLSWRMMAMHQVEVDDSDFEFNDLLALVSDRESLTGLVSGVTCTAGLLINGSRGGLVAALFGIAMALGYVRPKRGLISIPILILVLAASTAILVTPMNLNLESIQRLEFLSDHADTLQSDGRLTHWQDGWQAAIAYFPGGAGISSYGYAYLPYQDRSSGYWFQHADNLWLEMLVETGLVGASVFVMTLVILLISINRLALSVDPLDQGIRVACWYCIAAIFVSQFFDFGLAMPANLIVAILLGSAVVSRDYANGGPSAVLRQRAHQDVPYYDEDEFGDDFNGEGDTTTADYQEQDAPTPAAESRSRGKVRIATRPKRLASPAVIATFIVAVAVIILGGLALPGLRQDAISDSMLTRLDAEYSQWSMNSESLRRMQDALGDRIETRPAPMLYTRLATVQTDLGRLNETIEWQPQNEAQLRTILTQTDLSSRGLPYPPTPSSRDTTKLASYQHYRDAWDTSLASLLICPLAQQPRGDVLRLYPIVHDQLSQKSDDNDIAEVAVEQLLVFYASNANRMLTLGRESIQREDFGLAEKAFRKAIEVNPGVTSAVMTAFRDEPRANVSNAIPDSSVAMQMAAREYLNWQNPDPAFVRRCLKFVRYGEADTMIQRAACEALIGRMHFFLDETDEGEKHYQRAIQLAPEVAAHRIDLIDQLIRRNRGPEAMAQARLGRLALPDDTSFQKYIDQIAEADRSRLNQPGDAPSVSPEMLNEILK